jgi:hypothetical protein
MALTEQKAAEAACLMTSRICDETGGPCLSRCGERLCVAYNEARIGRMAQSTADRQRAFKAAMKEAGFVRLEAYVTKEQRDKFRQIGGDEWLRKKIEAAKPKGKE